MVKDNTKLLELQYSHTRTVFLSFIGLMVAIVLTRGETQGSANALMTFLLVVTVAAAVIFGIGVTNYYTRLKELFS